MVSLSLQHLTFSQGIVSLFDPYIAKVTHLWSVCVEFQMYLVSPFVISSMIKRGPYFVPILLVLLSVALSFIIERFACPPEIMAELVEKG